MFLGMGIDLVVISMMYVSINCQSCIFSIKSTERWYRSTARAGSFYMKPTECWYRSTVTCVRAGSME